MPSTWIFQCAPDRFDIEGYLALGLPRITWTVRQNGKRMAVGDDVFLWRAAGKKGGVAGIFTLGRINSPLWTGPDHVEARAFWIDQAGADQEQPRVWLAMPPGADATVAIARDRLRADPACADLLILRQAAGTNFPVEPDAARRLHELWAQAGKGRATNEVDRRRFEDEVRRELGRPLADLLAAYATREPRTRPSSSTATTTVFDRSALVVAIARKRAGDRCEVPGCTYEPFTTTGGEPYVEVHHIETLADGGPDRLENAACLCPAHHREIHCGKEAAVLRGRLREVRASED